MHTQIYNLEMLLRYSMFLCCFLFICSNHDGIIKYFLTSLLKTEKNEYEITQFAHHLDKKAFVQYLQKILEHICLFHLIVKFKHTTSNSIISWNISQFQLVLQDKWTQNAKYLQGLLMCKMRITFHFSVRHMKLLKFINPII